MTTLKEIEKMEKMKEKIDQMWEWLVDEGIATEEELQLVTDINGYSIETLNDVLYARTGYRDQE
jgi:signal-transduction protein with cAMP-binding, CBS, and nucleotidyltransferase domain